MPFFEGAQHFVIQNTEMNDIGGDYTKNETNTSVTNSDVGNRYIASVVSKGNTETKTATISGNNNTISVHGQHRVNGNIQLSDLPPLQNALQALPGIALSGIAGVQDPLVQAATAMQSALHPLSVDSTSPNHTSTSTGTKPLLAGNTSPNATSTSTVTEPLSVSSRSQNVASPSTVTELPSVAIGGPSSDGTETTAVPATRAAGPPAAPLLDDSLPKELLPPMETALVVPPQAAAEAGAVNTVGSATTKTNAMKAKENLQTSPMPATEQPKQRKGILSALVSIFRACF